MTGETIPQDRNLYVVQLTSLRGIACLVVLLGHVIQVINYHYTSRNAADLLRRAITGAVNAEGAVLVFFVLSGCVLALSLRNVSTFNFRILCGFYVKRIFRLYPLLWLSLIFAVFSMLATRDLAQAGIFSDWLNRNLLARISLTHSLLSLTGMYTAYNGPIWSLRAELIYSALFPAIYLLTKHSTYRKRMLIVLTLFALVPIPQHFCTGFAISFAAGACIPILSGRSGFHPAAVILALIIILYDRLALGGFNPPEHLFDLIETAAAFVIVRDIYVAGQRYRWLLSRPVVLLGELSFSIYLLHLPIFLMIFAFAAHCIGLPALLDHPTWSQIAFSLATAAVTIVISIFTYRFVELPMHDIGRRIGKQLQLPRPPAAVPSLPAAKAPSA